ncbi:hypothetical protein [Streptomyces sp. NBC_00063]|uniref:hypothetical protein n=1 Tax=Streptomyces sp. NBC_00063 TaxID=2975638 RepID=UPI00225585D9|nr:hypothetical protein [Streptomyces sp. NBC_00063]MCX5438743.1 hypothetical protein [Streptomyces sp. NBC_00063]
MYWKVSDAFLEIPDTQQQLARLGELRLELREAYALLMQSVRVVVLEGPAATADAAQAVQDAALKVNQCLWHIIRGDADARARFDDLQATYRQCQGRFVERARAATEAS